MGIDPVALLDELRMLAYEGRAYAESEYDQTRYRRLCQIVDEFYADLAGLPAAEVGERFAADLGTPTPKVGATAVIPDDDGRILLDRRADDGRWGLPGGWLGSNESPEAAVVREVAEETGLTGRDRAAGDGRLARGLAAGRSARAGGPRLRVPRDGR